MVKRTTINLCLALFAAIGNGVVRAQCVSLVKGSIETDAIACETVVPEQKFSGNGSEYQWIRDLDAAGRTKLFNDYRGALVEGRVVQSQAVRSGLSKDKGALADQTVRLFVPGNACAALGGKRLNGEITEVCCAGGAKAPCLLDTSYVLAVKEVVGPIPSGTPSGPGTSGSGKSQVQLEAEQLYAKKDLKGAVRQYETARRQNALNIRGLLDLAGIYRKADLCKRAVVPLEEIRKQWIQKKVYPEDEPLARRGVFHLAQCYAKMNDPGRTDVILQMYLVDPVKYEREIREALRPKSFGWINTSKEFKGFKVQARKALQKKQNTSPHALTTETQ